jgi:Protein of unknown function (DUF3489)
MNARPRDYAGLGVVEEPQSARLPNPKEPIMAQLSDTQLIILSNAAQHPDHIALPLPERLKGSATKIVVGSLLAKGLIEEVGAKRGEPLWRETGDGHGVTLVITDAGLAAIGVAPEKPLQAPHSAPKASRARCVAVTPKGASVSPADSPERITRDGTKQALMISMLSRPEGATIAEIVFETGWQQHTVRGAFAGALKKKLGLTIVSEKTDGRGRVYRNA